MAFKRVGFNPVTGKLAMDDSPYEKFNFNFGGKRIPVLVTHTNDIAEEWLNEENNKMSYKNKDYGIAVKAMAPSHLLRVGSMAVATPRRVLIFQFVYRCVHLEQLNETANNPDVRFVSFARDEVLQLLQNSGQGIDCLGRFVEARDVAANLIEKLHACYRITEFRPPDWLPAEEEEMPAEEEELFKKVLTLLRMPNDEKEFGDPVGLEHLAWHGMKLTKDQARYLAGRAWVWAKLRERERSR